MRILFGFVILLAGCSSSSFDVAGTGDGSVVDSTGSGDEASTDSVTIDSTPADTGGTSPDAGPEVVTSETGGPKCGDSTTFPSFDKGCTTDVNCSFGLHQTDCCGSQVAVGFNHGFKASFDAAESTWRMTCPACDCAPAPTKVDDGKTGDAIGVKCSSGICQTYVKS